MEKKKENMMDKDRKYQRVSERERKNSDLPVN